MVSFFLCFAGRPYCTFFWHSSIYSFIFYSRAYLRAPGLTVLFSSDTPDYSRLPSAAFIIFFFCFILLHRYVNEGMRQFEGLFISVVAAFHITGITKTTDCYACSQRQTHRLGEEGGALRFRTPGQNGLYSCPGG